VKSIKFVGLDVHAETVTVAVAVAEQHGEVRSIGAIPNRVVLATDGAGRAKCEVIVEEHSEF